MPLATVLSGVGKARSRADHSRKSKFCLERIIRRTSLVNLAGGGRYVFIPATIPRPLELYTCRMRDVKNR